MSSMDCKGNQSCFEPLVFEPCGLKEQFNQPKPHQWPQVSLKVKHQKEHQENPCKVEFNNKNNTTSNNLDHGNNNGEAGAWSFIQSLSNKNEHMKHNENVYVHPLVKKSTSILSLKSLEMCTESLGSETGSDTSETGDDFSLPLSPKTNEGYHQMWRLNHEKIIKKVSRKTNFPPPLTSISGFKNIQLTPIREGGRLVLKAATVSPSNSYFQTERVDGRLRLCLVENYSPTSYDFEIDGEYEQQQEEDYDDGGIWDENIERNSENIVEGNMGTEERPMPSRCNEGGHEKKGMPNWKPCLVAIS